MRAGSDPPCWNELEIACQQPRSSGSLDVLYWANNTRMDSVGPAKYYESTAGSPRVRTQSELAITREPPSFSGFIHMAERIISFWNPLFRLTTCPTCMMTHVRTKISATNSCGASEEHGGHANFLPLTHHHANAMFYRLMCCPKCMHLMRADRSSRNPAYLPNAPFRKLPNDP